MTTLPTAEEAAREFWESQGYVWTRLPKSMRAQEIAAWQASRQEAIEAAAKVAERYDFSHMEGPTVGIATAIRQLRAQDKPSAKDSAQDSVCSEILSIMEEYDAQMEASGYVDTPGGLEHMGDVWKLLDRWRDELTKPSEKGHD